MPVSHLSSRIIVKVSGPDARPFLQGLLTQDLDLLADGRPIYAGLLSAQGKTLFDLFLHAAGDDLLIDVNKARADQLIRRLAIYRLRRQVDFTLLPDMPVFQDWGADGNDPRLAATGNRLIGPLAEDAPLAPLADWHQQRLLLGLPASDEIGTDELLWLETNARELNGVSFTKGCYTGQENTSRMHYRERLRKRLLPVRLAGDAPADAVLMAGEREAGTLRGVRHGDLQMALLRMQFIDTPLTAGGVAAEVIRPPWLLSD